MQLIWFGVIGDEMEILIAFAQVFGCLLIIAFSLAIFIIILILSSIITGSSADPDDNGLLKTREQKEKWRKEKLAKHNIEL